MTTPVGEGPVDPAAVTGETRRQRCGAPGSRATGVPTVEVDVLTLALMTPDQRRAVYERITFNVPGPGQ